MKRWNRGIVNGMQHFWEKVELEEYSIYSVYSTSENGIARRAGIAGIVVRYRNIAHLHHIDLYGNIF